MFVISFSKVTKRSEPQKQRIIITTIFQPSRTRLKAAGLAFQH